MPTLLETIQHLNDVTQHIILTEAPQGWITQTHTEAEKWLGKARQYFVDLGFEDWPNAKTDGNTYLKAFADKGLSIPNTNLKIRSPRAHEIVIEPRGMDDRVFGNLLELPSNWQAYVQLADFHRPGDAIIWYGNLVRPDRQAQDPHNFIADQLGQKRVTD